MANAKYLVDKDGQKFYPIAHTQATLGADGKVLSDTLDEVDGRITHWFSGTALSGTAKNTNYSYSGATNAVIGDYYQNTSTGGIYRCVTGGNGTNAKWQYQGCINGKGISSSAVTYAASSSGTTAPSSWQSTIPSVAAGSYLWTRLVITHTDSTTSTCYSVARQGANGSNANANDRCKYAEKFTDSEGKEWAIISNRVIHAQNNTPRMYDLPVSAKNMKFVNCIFEPLEATDDYWHDGQGDHSCISGFGGSEDTVRDSLEFVNCTVYIGGILGGGDSGFDSNFIYECGTYKIDNCTFISYAVDASMNVIKTGNGSITNSRFIRGFDSSTSDGRVNIYHYDTDSSTSCGTFVGNYVEVNDNLYLKAGVVSGNEFNVISGDNGSIHLLCPTNMTGNHFKGAAVTINGHNKKHIIDRNLSDNSITIASGTTASGSVITNNVQY